MCRIAWYLKIQKLVINVDYDTVFVYVIFLFETYYYSAIYSSQICMDKKSSPFFFFSNMRIPNPNEEMPEKVTRRVSFFLPFLIRRARGI